MSNKKLRKRMVILLIVSVLVFTGASIYIKNYLPPGSTFVDLFPGYGRNGQVARETYPTGELRATGIRISGGRKDGEWRYYYKDGTLAMIETYEEGELKNREEIEIRESEEE